MMMALCGQNAQAIPRPDLRTKAALVPCNLKRRSIDLYACRPAWATYETVQGSAQQFDERCLCFCLPGLTHEAQQLGPMVEGRIR
jgi:3-phenylpropionate/cinnamic acid dioxygenase small subunit